MSYNHKQQELFKKVDYTIEDKKASKFINEYKKNADLENLTCPFEVFTIMGSNASMGYSTHSAFRYFGKFPPPVAKRFIQDYHKKEMGPVVDPMVGSGTTLVESLFLGCDAVGFDINPLSVLISKVKTTKLDRVKALKCLDNFSIFINDNNIDSHRINKNIPNDKYIDHWFLKKVQNDLALTKIFIESIENVKIKNLFTVSLAGIIRECSNASNNLGRMFLDPNKKIPNVEKSIYKRVNKILDGLDDLPFKNNILVKLHDSQKKYKTSKITNLIICHPPYFNLYKYSGIYKFEMLWCGFEPKETRSNEIRESFKIGKAERVHFYVDDLIKSINNISDLLVNNGFLMFMMGDTTLRDKRINTTSLFLNKLKKVDNKLKVEKFIIRIPKNTEASYAASMKRDSNNIGVKLYDHIIIFKKKNDR